MNRFSPEADRDPAGMRRRTSEAGRRTLLECTNIPLSAEQSQGVPSDGMSRLVMVYHARRSAAGPGMVSVM